MDIPLSFDDKCARLIQLFQAGIDSTIQSSSQLLRTWEHCLIHPHHTFQLEVVLVYGTNDYENAHNSSFPTLQNFARNLTRKNWMLRSHEISVLRECIHREQRDPFVVIVVRAQEKKDGTPMVPVPTTHSQSNWELSSNDKIFLRRLRIARDDETPSS